MGPVPAPHDPTFTGRQAADLAGITYRQLDYWCRLGHIRPLVPAAGSGSRRAFTPHQVGLLAVVGAAAPYLRNISHMEQVLDLLVDWPMSAWDDITLLVDGRTGEVWLPASQMLPDQYDGTPPPVAIAINLAGIKAQVRTRFETAARTAA